MKKNAGFTLIELLIAMTLTGIIGVILFSTYDMVLQYGKDSKNIVIEQEENRIIKAIFDNDFCNIALERNGGVAPIFKDFEEFSPLFSSLLESEKKELDEKILITFYTTFSLYNTENYATPLPVIVQYVLRKGKNGYYLVRRERKYAQIDIITNWEELVLLKQLESFEIAILYNGQYFTDFWALSESDKDYYPQGIRFEYKIKNQEEMETFLVPIMPYIRKVNDQK